jgi:MFS family permease
MSVKYTESSVFYSWYVVFLLFGLYLLSIIDRMALAYLAGPIKADFHLGDTQLGLLVGLGFGLLYTLVGLPLAHVIDHGRRVLIVTAGVLLWSICTVASAFSETYEHLVLLRAGVAIGEAVLPPAAVSIIADLFPRDRRAWPTSVYASSSVMVGGAFAVHSGAYQLANSFADGIGMASWRLTLIIIGLPGILLGLVLFITVKEPQRSDTLTSSPLPAASIKEAIRYVRGRGKLFAAFFIGEAAISIFAYAGLSWTTTIMTRSYGLDLASAGYAFGAIYLVAGIAGSLAWPYLVIRATAFRRNALVIALAIAAAMDAGALAAMSLTGTSLIVLFVLIAASALAKPAYAILSTIFIQNVTPQRFKARLIAAKLVASNLVGLIIGPAIVPILSDALFHGPDGLRSALSLLGICVGPIAVAGFMLMRRHYVAAMDFAAAEESTQNS